jgi:uncharacterized membrane protein
MKINRVNLASLALAVLAFVMAGALYSRLPAWVPTHWNASGRADGFTAKPWGPFILPVVTAAACLLMLLIPRISPRGFRVERFRRVFEIIQVTVVAFLFLVTTLVLVAGAGVPIPMDRAIVASTGLLLAVLGNFMGKVTKNFFVGIRTPWTLASDEVWFRTHRVGGRLFVAAGTVMVVSGLLGGGIVPVLVALAAAAVIPIVYSYVIYQRINGSRKGSTDDGDE